MAFDLCGGKVAAGASDFDRVLRSYILVLEKQASSVGEGVFFFFFESATGAYITKLRWRKKGTG